MVAVNNHQGGPWVMADLLRDAEPVSCEGAPTPVDDTPPSRPATP